jgi:TRADD-N domain-containing protein
MTTPDLKEIASYLVTGATVLTALAIFFVAIRSGVLRRLRLGFGSFEFVVSAPERAQARALIESVTHPDREAVPFETEQLAQYYSQVLAQSKTSFWFSLIFASLGFAVIVIAGFMYSSATLGATVAQFFAGVIMDAVSALFFVQSKNAQAAMAEFFDKLRRDRQAFEARKLCESLEDPIARDALRIELALNYAGIADSSKVSKSILNDWLSTRAAPGELGPGEPGEA